VGSEHRFPPEMFRSETSIGRRMGGRHGPQGSFARQDELTSPSGAVGRFGPTARRPFGGFGCSDGDPSAGGRILANDAADADQG
jgi:hypothetical protein